ncbi:hypothetical protein GGF31_003271 [Allomyces arbusculus]|nr:hypothetical protein GGF31_003271 [Allomyces arbusculus]
MTWPKQQQQQQQQYQQQQYQQQQFPPLGATSAPPAKPAAMSYAAMAAAPPAQHANPSYHAAAPAAAGYQQAPSRPVGNVNAQLSDFIADLWDADENRFVPGRDFVLDIQSGKSVGDSFDAAAHPLFQHVDTQKLLSVPTFAAFYALLDNYVDQTGIAEQVTKQERQEEFTFLEEVMKTRVGQMAFEFAKAKQWFNGSVEQWRAFLHKLWFTLHKREIHGDTSPFEHIFVGEIRGGQVIGFHNWITIFLAESKRILDYQGYIWPRRRHSAQPTNDTHLLKLQFLYRGKRKPLSTSLIGVSPEFELMLYTLSYLSGKGKVNCVLDDSDCGVIVHINGQGANRMIGSAYIEMND